ncbi:GntR family transcriptional regulator [Microbacterium betulae]|uniref:GntR family transcriptional regulator n=1 Tax=Microbacterium betulae TaxID=2981139 RepID=A0AA97FGZ3_9MICO|nr:GntR family transcriptional regulator [Microbacterium sp. AB]WOF22988.1 GntR family transcriptional regulator [Microbacterium sp. AB]
MEPLLTLTGVPDGVDPLYERIAGEVRRRIDSGLWGNGQQFKSEPELAADIGVARGTLRRAFTDLVRTGHVVQRQGLGTFVSPEKAGGRGRTFESLGERMTAAGMEFETRVLGRHMREPGSWGARPENGPAVQLRRLRSANGEPVSVLHNCIPTALAPTLTTTALDGRSLYRVLELDFGLALGRSDLTFAARAADAELAGLLRVAPGTPLTHLSQVTFGLDDRTVVDIAETWIRPDRHQPTVSLWRNP